MCPESSVTDGVGINPCLLVGARGFEPPTPCAQGRCATGLRYAPTVGALYAIEPRGDEGMEGGSGGRAGADIPGSPPTLNIKRLGTEPSTVVLRPPTVLFGQHSRQQPAPRCNMTAPIGFSL